MTLKRLQIEPEGFLGGLDLEFVPGLNVIIGARGTGKTSIIELVRYVLSVSGFTEDAEERGAMQASAILQGGAASITYGDENGTGTITRSGSGYISHAGINNPRCTILAQNEVESVGAQSLGRLHLIDRFRPQSEGRHERIKQLNSELESLTVQISDVLAEGNSLASQVKELAGLEGQLTAARGEQEMLLSQAEASQQDREELSELEASSNQLASSAETVSEAFSEISVVTHELNRLRDGSWISIWQGAAQSKDPRFAGARESVGNAYQALDVAVRELQRASDELESLSSEILQRRRVVDENGRRLRQRLDAVQSGIGVASRRVQEMEERLGQLRATTQRLQDRRQRYQEIASRRDILVEEVEDERDRVYSERAAVAGSLNSALGPQIRVRIQRSARTEAYQAAIISALRGSGLHYNSLAPSIARAVSPVELVNWVERADVSELGEALQLTRDRSVALIGALRSSGLAQIAASEIEDDAVFELLDGRDYKTTDRLSIGQRCTVVLPILFGQHGDTLLVDQPEDHLDNAFIASTLVAALRARRPTDQFILTSHNANIPVLGDADNVIVMQSDGDRGFVSAAGRLEDSVIVNHINNIMEGGREAFAARSAFYEEHGG